MQIPRIKFNEITNNRFPIAQGIRNRLGIVGKFSRGPANLFQYVNGFEEFAQVYGSDTSSGSLGVQAAFDQGSRDFGLIRVMGRTKNAKGNLTIGGTALIDNRVIIKVVGVEDAEPSINSNFSINITPDGSIYTGGDDGYYVFKVNEEGASGYQATLVWGFYSEDEVSSAGEAVALLQKESAEWNANSKLETDSGIDFPTHTSPSEGEKRGSIVVDTSIDGGTSKEIPGTNGLKLTFGTDSNNTNVDFQEGQAFTLKVFHFEDSVRVSKNDQSLEIAQKIENKLQGVYPFGSITNELAYVSGGNSPYSNTLVFELDGSDPELEGSKGNNYYYSVNLVEDGTTPAGEPGISLSLPNSGQGSNTAGFKGGVDGPQNAKATLYDTNSNRLIEIVASSPGEWGNELRMSINYIDTNTFRINVEDAEASNFNPPIPNESFLISLTSSNAIDELGEIEALKDSILIRGYFLPARYNPTGYDVASLNKLPARIAISKGTSVPETDPSHALYVGPRALGSAPFDEEIGTIPITFEGGSEGPVLVEDDYVQAAKLFEGQQVHYIFAPGTYTNLPKLQAQLVTVAENSSELDGLKLAILNTKPSLKPSAAFRETLGINSRRAVIVSGWSTYAGQPNTKRFSLSPDAVYAGKISNLAFYISPAARTTAGPVSNITEVDNSKYTSLSSLQFYTDARIEVLFQEQSLGGFFFLNGITSSSDPNWERIFVRRTYDIIRQDLFLGLQNYKSEPHTPLLRKQLETSINAYMNNQLRNGRIANTTQAVANASNNQQDNYINGELNVSISFLPLYAADYINVDIQRNIDGGLQIS